MSQSSKESKTFTASGAITKHTLVKWSSAGVVATVAGSYDRPIGVALATVADGELVPVELFGDKTFKVEADAGVTAGAVAYQVANGRLGHQAIGSGNGFLPLQTATTGGDVIEALPILVK